MRYLHAIALLSFALPVAGCIEYGIHPLWRPSLFQRLECDEEEDRNAAAEDRPVAVCSADHASLFAIHEATTLRGKASYDPSGGEIIGHEWKLVEVPRGSRARLQGEDDRPERRLRPDMVGTYVAELTVINDECITSDPCAVVVEAVPANDLWVEMFWSHDGEDMDLHLLREDARRDSMGDCYYDNCVGGGLDWDVQGQRSDDPRLDLDDIEGTGPENINISDPGASWYTVAVHDFPDSVRERPTDVTVRVYLAGEKAFEETRTLRGEDRFEEFAEIDWEALEVFAL